MEDKQIYAYSWQQDLLKKVKNYFKREKKKEKPKKKPSSPKETPTKKVETVKIEATNDLKPEESKKEKPTKKEKNKESDIFKKERKEKILTGVIGISIILIVSAALLIQNNVFNLSSPPSEPKNIEAESINPNPTKAQNPGKKISLTPTEEITTTPIYSPVDTSGCKIGGCNGEICADENLGNVSSICLYQNKFVCYKNATCERQRNGNCGWTQTKELKVCLETYSN